MCENKGAGRLFEGSSTRSESAVLTSCRSLAPVRVRERETGAVPEPSSGYSSGRIRNKTARSCTLADSCAGAVHPRSLSAGLPVPSPSCQQLPPPPPTASDWAEPARLLNVRPKVKRWGEHRPTTDRELGGGVRSLSEGQNRGAGKDHGRGRRGANLPRLGNVRCRACGHQGSLRGNRRVSRFNVSTFFTG